MVVARGPETRNSTIQTLFYNLLMCPEDASCRIPAQKQPFPPSKAKSPSPISQFYLLIDFDINTACNFKTRLSGGLSQPLREYKESWHFLVT